MWHLIWVCKNEISVRQWQEKPTESAAKSDKMKFIQGPWVRLLSYLDTRPTILWREQNRIRYVTLKVQPFILVNLRHFPQCCLHTVYLQGSREEKAFSPWILTLYQSWNCKQCHLCKERPGIISPTATCLNSLFFFGGGVVVVVLWFELRPSCLLGRCCTTWATPQPILL
jgi:hypothetical protein